MPQHPDKFVLDARLEADAHVIGELALSRVLLMNDARFPWLILVPRRADLRDWIDLAEPEQHLLLDEIRICAQGLRTLFRPDKLNIASLGNVVAQLHIHVIARFTHDAAWPRPVWGAGKASAYASETLAEIAGQLRCEFQIARPT